MSTYQDIQRKISIWKKQNAHQSMASFEDPYQSLGQQIAQHHAFYQQQTLNQQGGLSNGAWGTNSQIHSGAAGAASQGFAPGAVIPLSWNTTHHFPSPNRAFEDAGIKVGEVIGWRIWNIKGNYLESYSAAHIWAPSEEMEGKPQDDNDAGCWAFNTKRRAIAKMLQNAGPAAYGSIKMWGKIYEYSEGYRAQYAKITSIDDCMAKDSQIFKNGKKEVLQALRETYGLLL